jgi:hypothetical protein
MPVSSLVAAGPGIRPGLPVTPERVVVPASAVVRRLAAIIGEIPGCGEDLVHYSTHFPPQRSDLLR